MEGVPAHKIDGGECESVLAVRAIIGQERLGGCLQLFELVAAFLALADVFADYFSIFFDVLVVLLESA